MASEQQKQPWQLTAAEALPLLHSGDLKAEDYVNSLLHRIQQRDEAVKAWVYLNPNQVIQQARHLDEVSAKARGPLHGLPVAVKDVILTKDMPTQYNSKLFESETPIAADANCVMSLRAAGRYLSLVLHRLSTDGALPGAIIFGKTSTTEFATTKQGNWHQNLTTNPHDKTRTPGGSSSGSGAAVGDFQVPISLGTQVSSNLLILVVLLLIRWYRLAGA